MKKNNKVRLANLPKMKASAIALGLVATLALAGCASAGGQDDSGDTAANGSTVNEDNNANNINGENNADATPITLVLDWTPNTNHTGIFVAANQGFFEAEGLDVSIVQPPQDGAELMVGAGRAEFGISFQDTMAAALIGSEALPITAVATLIQHNTSGIMSRAGEGMDRPSGLVGMQYATWDLPIEKAMLQRVVEADGGNFDDVVLIPSTVTDEVSALRTGAVDAIWVFYAWAGVAAEIAGLDTDYFAFSDIDPVFDYYTPVIIANNDFLANHPEVAKAFLRAVERGYKFAIDNPEEAANILLAEAPELDAELVNASQMWLTTRYMADEERWGYISAERWDAFYHWLGEEGLVPEAIPAGTGFNNDFLPSMNE